ncbi:MAG: hypothetical protein LBE62_12355 [Azonexus sp.]|jgi:hypothetical protein|nr:hypothetical protein [Azonexus sp.]
MTATIPSLAALTGALRLVPGAPLPDNLSSTRPALASRFCRGRSVRVLPDLLAALFSLCGHAHRLCAQLAIAAAAPELPAPEVPVLMARLRRETALEHLRRIGLDWPRLLDMSVAEAAAGALRACPLPGRDQSADGGWRALRGWLATELLRLPGEHWLAAWDTHGADWLHDWSQYRDGWLATMLAAARAADDPAPVEPALALRLHAPEAAADLAAFGAALDADPALALQPRWRGACAHTGVWTRLCHPAPPPLTAWSLLGARIAELIRLSGPDEDGAGLLRCGALLTGPRRGLAWVEMARGLLLHQVTLDGEGEAATIRACQVVAPTEWNFHPEGVVAQALARLPLDPADEQRRRANLLMAAFDPCLPFTLAKPGEEGAHA